MEGGESLLCGHWYTSLVLACRRGSRKERNLKGPGQAGTTRTSCAGCLNRGCVSSNKLKASAGIDNNSQSGAESSHAARMSMRLRVYARATAVSVYWWWWWWWWASTSIAVLSGVVCLLLVPAMGKGCWLR